MDIDLLSKMVKELILDHDKVALPGVGSFVAEMLPASFSDKGYTINPPYRRLGFRQHLEEDDLLARLYAGSNGISVEDAEKILRDFLAEMKKLLFIKKVIVFPELGRLRATKENSIFFVAEESLDIFPEGLGLVPLSLKNHNASAVTSKIVELADTISKPADKTAEVAETPAKMPVEAAAITAETVAKAAETPAETPVEAAATPAETVEKPAEVEEDPAEPHETASESATDQAESADNPTIAAQPVSTEEEEAASNAETAIDQTSTDQAKTATEQTAIEQTATGQTETATEKTAIEQTSIDQAETATEQEDNPTPNATEVEADDNGKPRKHRKAMLVAGIVILSLLILLLLCAMLFFIGMTWFPDLLDHLLYSKEELEIIHYWN